MPQKPLLKPGKKIEKKQAANRHGKTATTRKGKFEKPPKKSNELVKFNEQKELTKYINANNESNFATIAQQKGGKLKALNAPPPALAPKDKLKKKGKAADDAAKDSMSEDDE